MCVDEEIVSCLMTRCSGVSSNGYEQWKGMNNGRGGEQDLEEVLAQKQYKADDDEGDHFGSILMLATWDVVN